MLLVLRASRMIVLHYIIYKVINQELVSGSLTLLFCEHRCYDCIEAGNIFHSITETRCVTFWHDDMKIKRNKLHGATGNWIFFKVYYIFILLYHLTWKGDVNLWFQVFCLRSILVLEILVWEFETSDLLVIGNKAGVELPILESWNLLHLSLPLHRVIWH